MRVSVTKKGTTVRSTPEAASTTREAKLLGKLDLPYKLDYVQEEIESQMKKDIQKIIEMQ